MLSKERIKEAEHLRRVCIGTEKINRREKYFSLKPQPKTSGNFTKVFSLYLK